MCEYAQNHNRFLCNMWKFVFFRQLITFFVEIYLYLMYDSGDRKI